MADREEAIQRLRKILKPGDDVYVIVKHVSSSGMYRRMAVYALLPVPRKARKVTPWWLTRLAATALGWRFDQKHETIGVGGCGMDMAFHLVYELSGVLFPKHTRPGYVLNKVSL